MTQEEGISPLVSTDQCMIRVRHTVPRQKSFCHSKSQSDFPQTNRQFLKFETW